MTPKYPNWDFFLKVIVIPFEYLENKWFWQLFQTFL